MEVEVRNADHVVGVFQRPLDVAELVAAVPADVRADLGVDDGRVLGRRGEGVDHGVERLVVDHHPLSGVFSACARLPTWVRARVMMS